MSATAGGIPAGGGALKYPRVLGARGAPLMPNTPPPPGADSALCVAHAHARLGGGGGVVVGAGVGARTVALTARCSV